jgi:hypothetical protein
MRQAYKRTADNGEWFLIVVVIPLVVLALMLAECK